MKLREFQVTIHARTKEVKDAGRLELSAVAYPTLNLPAGALSAPFDVSFETASESLQDLERMFLEPDGSFVWVSAADEPRWQLDGVLYDRDGRLLYVDLKGTCTAPQFDRLLAALGWPQMPVMFQLAREAAFLSEAEFRRYAGLSASRPSE